MGDPNLSWFLYEVLKKIFNIRFKVHGWKFFEAILSDEKNVTGVIEMNGQSYRVSISLIASQKEVLKNKYTQLQEMGRG